MRWWFGLLLLSASVCGLVLPATERQIFVVKSGCTWCWPDPCKKKPAGHAPGEEQEEEEEYPISCPTTCCSDLFAPVRVWACPVGADHNVVLYTDSDPPLCIG